MELYDSHFHLIDPRFPLVPNHGYLPPSYDLEDYRTDMRPYTIRGGVIVSGSFQGFDQSYLLEALRMLGGNYRAVANIPPDCPDALVGELHIAGVAGVRFNLKRGSKKQLEYMVPLARRLHDPYGWHTELYVASEDLPALKPYLEELPAFSIDHVGLSQKGLAHLYYWVERGVRVKATGFSRLDFDPGPVLQQIHRINPEALLFGSDLPGTRAPEPFGQEDMDLLISHFPDSSDLERILFRNAEQWYLKGAH